MIRFTVVTITYNAAAVLQRTLDSVLSQTYPEVEHLIIDGASTDGTLQMLNHYKALNSVPPTVNGQCSMFNGQCSMFNGQCSTVNVQRSMVNGQCSMFNGQRSMVNGQCSMFNGHQVIIKSEPDDGIYDAMNKGLTQASGDYIVFMNAGDSFPGSDTLEQVVHRCHLAELPSAELPAVLYGNTDIVDGDGRYLHPRRLQPPAQLSWKSFRHGMLVCHQAFYARADIAKNVQYDTRYRYSADVDWCIRVMREASRLSLPLSNINMVVANYTEEGATTRHHRESLLERFSVMRRHYGLLTTIAMHAWFVVRAIAH